MKKAATMPTRENAIYNPVEGKWEKKVRSERDFGHVYSALASVELPEIKSLDSFGESGRPGQRGRQARPDSARGGALRTHNHPEVGDKGVHGQTREHSHPEIGDDGRHKPMAGRPVNTSRPSAAQTPMNRPPVNRASINQQPVNQQSLNRFQGEWTQSSQPQNGRSQGKNPANAARNVIWTIFAIIMFTNILRILLRF